MVGGEIRTAGNHSSGGNIHHSAGFIGHAPAAGQQPVSYTHLDVYKRQTGLEDYIARRDFTRCVEQDMTNGIIAEAFEMDRDDLKRRRAQSVRNVRATNGTISLEKYARSRQEPDWDDDEWQD